jgi:predicted nucleotide-binding protein
MQDAQAVVALFTPDDLAQLQPRLLEKGEIAEPPTGQPRPNVLFETGLAFALKPPRAVIVVQLGHVRKASDLDGLNYVNLPEGRAALRRRLIDAGCDVSEASDAWYREGNFERAHLRQHEEPGDD